MAIKKTKWSKPSRYGKGLKCQIRFDFSSGKYIIVAGSKRIHKEKDFKTPQEARDFILQET